MRTFSDDVVVFRVGRGDQVHGRRAVSALVTAYPQAGVELRPTRVLSSGRVTVLEGRFVELIAEPAHKVRIPVAAL